MLGIRSCGFPIKEQSHRFCVGWVIEEHFGVYEDGDRVCSS